MAALACGGLLVFGAAGELPVNVQAAFDQARAAAEVAPAQAQATVKESAKSIVWSADSALGMWQDNVIDGLYEKYHNTGETRWLQLAQELEYSEDNSLDGAAEKAWKMYEGKIDMGEEQFKGVFTGTFDKLLFAGEATDKSEAAARIVRSTSEGLPLDPHDVQAIAQEGGIEVRIID